jgi:hypothetical protein
MSEKNAPKESKRKLSVNESLDKTKKPVPKKKATEKLKEETSDCENPKDNLRHIHDTKFTLNLNRELDGKCFQEQLMVLLNNIEPYEIIDMLYNKPFRTYRYTVPSN